MSDNKQPFTLSVEEIFLTTLEKPSVAERAAYLDVACGKDTETRSKIERLLASYKEDDFLEQSAISVDPTRVTLTDLREKAGTIIGRYKLLEQIGEGGFGVVFLAEQEDPVRRQVALKVIKAGMDTKQVIARFEAERQALALMDHPNIAKVHDAGSTENGRPFFVMELVRGLPITKFCEENQLTVKERLELFIPVCQGIQHAHQKGVIHRDIKPTNVLVASENLRSSRREEAPIKFGTRNSEFEIEQSLLTSAASGKRSQPLTLNSQPIPKVIDFGVAKAINQGLTEKTLFTNAAQMIGTPAYMSPEQAEMGNSDVDTRTDVYSLGILLYELLTGTTPFPEERLKEVGYAELQRIITAEEPVRPSTVLTRLNGKARAIAANRRCEPAALQKLIKGDLDWIVLKAIDKDRNRRYATPLELVADIARFLNDEPILARPISRIGRAWRWCRRKPALATALLSISILILVVLIGSPIAVYRINEARDNAVQQARQARLNHYIADVGLAHRALLDFDIGRAKELLATHVPGESEEDLRSWEWNYLWNQCLPDDVRPLGEHPDSVASVAFSPSGRQAASGDSVGNIYFWDLPSGDRRITFTQEKAVNDLLFYSDDVLVAADQSGSVKFCDIRSETVLKELMIGASVRRIALSPQHDALAVLRGFDGAEGLDLWNIASGRSGELLLTHRYTLPGPEKGRGSFAAQGALAFSPNGHELAVGHTDATIQILDVETGQVERILTGHHGAISALAYSPDGRWIASGAIYWDNTIRIWDIASGEVLAEVSGHTRWVSALAFCNDGSFLLSSSGDQTIRQWDTATWSVLRVFLGHTWAIRGMDLARSNETFITGGKDQKVLLWDLRHQATHREPAIMDGVTSAQFSPAGDYVATVERSTNNPTRRRLVLRDTRGYNVRSAIDGLGESVSSSVFSDDAAYLALLGQDSVEVWDVQGQRLIGKSDAPGRGNDVIAGFTADRACLILIDPEFTVRRRRIATGKIEDTWSARGLNLLPTYFRDSRVAYHPVSSVLILGTDGLASVWDVVNHRWLADLSGHQFASVSPVISPDGRLIATVGDDGNAFLWDAITFKQLRRFQTPRGGFHSGAFSADNRRLAIGIGAIWLAGIYDVATGRELLLIPGDSGYVIHVQWSRDGTALVAQGEQTFIWKASHPAQATVE